MATQLSHSPPIGALFAAFLGYNPMATLIPAHVLSALPASTQATILGTSFFPKLIADPFLEGLRVAFIVCVALSLAAAAASWMRGRRYIHDLEVASQPGSSVGELATGRNGPAVQPAGK
jgi:hypothetical protein